MVHKLVDHPVDVLVHGEGRHFPVVGLVANIDDETSEDKRVENIASFFEDFLVVLVHEGNNHDFVELLFMLD